jgi:hypothetical protein
MIKKHEFEDTQWVMNGQKIKTNNDYKTQDRKLMIKKHEFEDQWVMNGQKVKTNHDYKTQHRKLIIKKHESL